MFGNILSSIFSEMEYETNGAAPCNCGCTKCRQNTAQSETSYVAERYRSKVAPRTENHHIHQKAAYPPEFHNKMSTVALTKDQHLGASALQRAFNQVLGNRPVGDKTQKRLQTAGVSVQATGNGKLRPTPNPWVEDQKAFYGLRAAGLPPDDAYVETMRSAGQNKQLGARPTRIPKGEMEFNF